MKTLQQILPALLAVTALLTSPAPAAEKTDALLPVYQFIENMNKGDVESALVVCSRTTSIIDNVAPYHWHGADACKQWSDSLNTHSTAEGVTDSVFVIEDASYLDLGEDYAYGVLPASYRFSQKGAEHQVQGSLTVVMQRASEGWQLVAFAFTQK